MSKLKQHLDESRNIEGDIGKIIKISKAYIKQKNDITKKMLKQVGRIIGSVEKSLDNISGLDPTGEFDGFIQDMFEKLEKIGDPDLERDIESIL